MGLSGGELGVGCGGVGVWLEGGQRGAWAGAGGSTSLTGLTGLTGLDGTDGAEPRRIERKGKGREGRERKGKSRERQGRGRERQGREREGQGREVKGKPHLEIEQALLGPQAKVDEGRQCKVEPKEKEKSDPH